MDHVVFFPDADGSEQFRRTSSLEEAVALVERLRNEQGVDNVSVFALTEVPVSFRAYYRVEVAGAAGPAVPEPPVEVAAAGPAVPEPPVEVPVVTGEAPVGVAGAPVGVEPPAAVDAPFVPAPRGVDAVPSYDEAAGDMARSLGFFAGQG